MGKTACCYGYSSGPMISGNRVNYIDAKIQNNDKKKSLVRVKQYDLLPAGKQLLLDSCLTIPARGSFYLGLLLLDTWEVQFICNSPLVRCWLGGLDNDFNLEPGCVLLHSHFITFEGGSLQPIKGKRQPEILESGYRR